MAGIGGGSVVTKCKFKKDKRKGQSWSIYSEPSCGKTSFIADLLIAGYTVTYLDLDGNEGPFENLNEEQLGRMQYIKLRDTMTSFSIAHFFEKCIDELFIKVCTEHGVIDCPKCSKNSEMLKVIPSNFDTDFVVIDSGSSYMDSAHILIKKTADALTKKTSYNHFGAQDLFTNMLKHFIKACNTNVILLTHALNCKDGLDPDAVDDFYPYMGSKPKSKKNVYAFSHIWRALPNADTFQFCATRTHFASSRNIHNELKGKTRVEAIMHTLSKDFDNDPNTTVGVVKNRV